MLEKARKRYHFVPPMAPSLSMNKPRLDSGDQDTLSNIVEIKINDYNNPSLNRAILQEYHENMEQQERNGCLISMPQALTFLRNAMDQQLLVLPRWLWTQSLEACDEEKKLIEVMQLVLTDFYANCCRPEPLPPLNERTPFCDHVIPVIKYFNAVYKTLHLQW